MFKIESLRADEDARTLSLSADLFHEALQYKPESKVRFHVKNDKGEDFDIVYWDNDEDIEPKDTYPPYIKRPFMAKYDIYDENDKLISSKKEALSEYHPKDRVIAEGTGEPEPSTQAGSSETGEGSEETAPDSSDNADVSENIRQNP